MGLYTMKSLPRQTEKTPIVRTMRSGTWYWASKIVIRHYVPLIGFHAACVYHFLASMANESQCCFPSQKYIADQFGCARSTVGRAIKVLEKHGLIHVTRRSRYHCIYHLLDVRCRPKETQMSRLRTSDDSLADTNNTKLIRSTNNIVSDLNTERENTSHLGNGNQERQALLVSDIAEGLGDQGNARLFRSYVQQFPEQLLREALANAKQTPQHLIRKSRTALFVSLVRRYAAK